MKTKLPEYEGVIRTPSAGYRKPDDLETYFEHWSVSIVNDSDTKELARVEYGYQRAGYSLRDSPLSFIDDLVIIHSMSIMDDSETNPEEVVSFFLSELKKNKFIDTVYTDGKDDETTRIYIAAARLSGLSYWSLRYNGKHHFTWKRQEVSRDESCFDLPQTIEIEKADPTSHLLDIQREILCARPSFKLKLPDEKEVVTMVDNVLRDYPVLVTLEDEDIYRVYSFSALRLSTDDSVRTIRDLLERERVRDEEFTLYYYRTYYLSTLFDAAESYRVGDLDKARSHLKEAAANRPKGMPKPLMEIQVEKLLEGKNTMDLEEILSTLRRQVKEAVMRDYFAKEKYERIRYPQISVVYPPVSKKRKDPLVQLMETLLKLEFSK